MSASYFFRVHKLRGIEKLLKRGLSSYYLMNTELAQLYPFLYVHNLWSDQPPNSAPEARLYFSNFLRPLNPGSFYLRFPINSLPAERVLNLSHHNYCVISSMGRETLVVDSLLQIYFLRSWWSLKEFYSSYGSVCLDFPPCSFMDLSN
jgi:hypothetical protein